MKAQTPILGTQAGEGSASQILTASTSIQPVPFTATALFNTLGYCVSWTLGEAKYHVWTDEAGNVISIYHETDYPTLYKNSISPYRTKGHFDCRKLNATAKANKAMIAQALAQVDLKVAKAAYEQQEAEKEATRQAEAKARDAKERIEAAAPELLEALQACLHRLDEHDEQSAPECLLARAAILKATQPA